MRIKNRTIGFNSTLDMTRKMDHGFFAHSISDDKAVEGGLTLLVELLSLPLLLWITVQIVVKFFSPKEYDIVKH